MTVKVMDAGGKLMLSGDSREEVAAALDKQIKRGAKCIGATHQLGTSWIASCTLPPKGADADTTTTLHLSDFVVDKKASAEPEVDDGCRVEEFGFERLITGPTRQAVLLRLDHMKRFGADLVGEIQEQDGAWVAIVDTGGAAKSYRF